MTEILRITFTTIMVVLIVIAIWQIYKLIVINKKLTKLDKAFNALMSDIPLSEWDAKYGKFIQDEYCKCDDPHRQEIEECMEFFKQFIRESEKGGEDGRD